MADDAELGPKMLALTEKQRGFVMALIENPGITQGKAAELAGYQNSPLGHRVKGHVLAHDARVLAAIHEVAGQRMRSHSLLAADVLTQLLGSADEKIQLKAAGMLLDRVGFGAQQNININQTISDQSGKAIMERIRSLTDKHGIKLVGGPEPVDAEFSEVKDG